MPASSSIWWLCRSNAVTWQDRYACIPIWIRHLHSQLMTNRCYGHLSAYATPWRVHLVDSTHLLVRHHWVCKSRMFSDCVRSFSAVPCFSHETSAFWIAIWNQPCVGEPKLVIFPYHMHSDVWLLMVTIYYISVLAKSRSYIFYCVRISVLNTVFRRQFAWYQFACRSPLTALF